MPKPILGYWNIRGFGQIIRFMCAYLGIDYDEKLYTDHENRSDWLADRCNLGLDFPNIPYWIDGDVRLTESKAILRHLARENCQEKNLIPSDPKSTRQMDMLENVFTDILPLLGRVCYGDSDFDKEMLKTQAPVKYELLSKFLGTKKFLLGDQLTYVDFIFYEVMFFYTEYDADYLNPYPNLKEYKKRFEAIPEIVAYTKSPKYIAKGCTLRIAKHPL